MPDLETPKGWRIAIISMVLPVAEPLIAHLRELGHEPVAWLIARRKEGDERPLPPWGEITDSMAPKGVSLLFARDKEAVAPLLRGLEPDLVLCWGFGWKLPQEALDVPRLGSVNHHPALLPRHRGPIPLSWALRENDGTFGMTWHRMDAELDTGAILAQKTVPIEDDWTTIEEMGPTLLQAAFELLPQVFERLAAGDPGDPQPTEGVSWAGHLRRGLRDRRLVSARPEDPRPGARLAPHVRHVAGRRADRGARRRARQAPAHEPHRPWGRRTRRRVRRRDALDPRVRARWLNAPRPTTMLMRVPIRRRAPAFGCLTDHLADAPLD